MLPVPITTTKSSSLGWNKQWVNFWPSFAFIGVTLKILFLFTLKWINEYSGPPVKATKYLISSFSEAPLQKSIETNYFDFIVSRPYNIFTFLSSLLLRSTITIVGMS